MSPFTILEPDQIPPEGEALILTAKSVLQIEKSDCVVVGGTTTIVTVSDCKEAGPKSLTETMYCEVMIGQT